MPNQAQLLDAFRKELIALDLVRRPPVAGSEYPLFVEPEGGAPAPGEREGTEDNADMILTAKSGGDIPSAAFSGFIREATIDLYLRAAKGKAMLPMQLEPQINAAIVDKWAWTMGGLYVLESGLYAGLQEVRNAPGDGTTWSVKYRFQIYRD
jgi:hypothetical protein